MERNLRKTQVGIVTSDKMEKTVVVSIKDRVKHPLYSKIVNRTVKVKAHDENNECGIGDRVLLMETRPMSKSRCSCSSWAFSLPDAPRVPRGARWTAPRP